MTTLDYMETLIFPAAFALLPARMDSAEARAIMLAIGLQEARFRHRRQLEGGPARGFWQFERGGGVTGVLQHAATRPHILYVLTTLSYDASPETSYTAIEHNDVLAACYARLNLWWLPQALPKRGEAGKAWGQYLDAWRPGKPHRETWDAFFAEAWA